MCIEAWNPPSCNVEKRTLTAISSVLGGSGVNPYQQIRQLQSPRSASTASVVDSDGDSDGSGGASLASPSVSGSLVGTLLDLTA
jgi:hypothetical protein